MQMPENTFKRSLAEARLQIGLWSSLPGSYAAEILAGSGFDWLLFDTEHSPSDPLTVLGQLQAIASYPVAPVVRPAANDPVLIKRFLDIGAQTLLIPMIQNAAEAEAAVKAVCYPPAGIRGVAGTTRANRFGRVKGYMPHARDAICLLVQVETVEAVENIEAIAAVNGVDGIFVGPADLAASMGYVGQPNHPEVCDLVEGAIRRIVKAGKPAGILTLDQPFAQRCIEQGATFTAVGVDAALLVSACDALRTTAGSIASCQKESL